MLLNIHNIFEVKKNKLLQRLNFYTYLLNCYRFKNSETKKICECQI